MDEKMRKIYIDAIRKEKNIKKKINMILDILEMWNR